MGCGICTELWSTCGAISPQIRIHRCKNQDIKAGVASLIISLSDSRMEFVFPVPETVDAVRSEVLDPESGKVQGSTHLEVVTNTVESLWVSYSSGQAGKE